MPIDTGVIPGKLPRTLRPQRCVPAAVGAGLALLRRVEHTANTGELGDMRKLLTAAALLAAAATAFAASNRPAGFTTICSIGESCSVSGATNVAFGAADQFVFK